MQTAEKILELPNTSKLADTSFLTQIKRSRPWVTLTNWEYWPMWAANLPLFFIMAFFALRARRLLFFSAVNPVIETGGMWGESKFNILQRIPDSHLPPTIFVEKGTDFQVVIEKMRVSGLNEWPVIAKPDVGERGLLVKKIKDEADLRDYLLKNNIDFLVQKFIPEPLELAVMCHQIPGSASVKVTSICIKETLKVMGDGRSSVRALMLRSDRARLQLSRFEVEKPALLDKIPKLGEILELEPIGNHCKGTMFLNGNPEIDEALTSAFKPVLSKMDNIFYGRFDLKCQSFEQLRSTGEFMTMEFNGIGAEAGHIYDPTYPVWKKIRDIYQHWNVIFKIYKIQERNGVSAMTIRQGIERLRIYLDYKKSISKT